tara:strand:- start:633 stop:815 length:183 start_codon:yes stop_codon:yes gene_type:complete
MVRITPSDARKMADAYSKVYAPQEEETPESSTESAPESESEYQSEIEAAAAKLSSQDEDA